MKRIYLIMLMIAAAMMMSCNPKEDDDNNNTGGNVGGNGITGVYNPEKKISKIIHEMNYFYETEEIYEWSWGDNSLEITNSYQTLKYLFDAQYRLTSVGAPSGKYIYSLIYKGNKLVEAKYLNKYDNDDCKYIYRLEYSANKLSKVEWIYYPNDDPDIYVYDIVWNGNNVSEINGYDKEGSRANIHMSFEYDDKKNPFYGLLYLPADIWAGEGTYDAIASISENNITRIVVDSNFEGYSYTNNFTYEYDKDGYPVFVTVSEDSTFEIKYLSDNNNNDGEIDNSDEDWWNVEVDKNVLLEKYTGVRCVNCPYANQLALELQEKYGDRLVILNVHAGPLSVPVPGSFPDFTTDEGAEWFDSLGIVSIPIGFINRKYNEGYYSHEWDDEIANIINEKSFVNIIPTINYNNSTRDLTVEIKSQFDKELFGTYNLTVCIMEDDIVGAQHTPQGNDPEYVHHNVFRETMTGTWGDNLELSGEVVKSYSMTLNPDYNDDNCYIIAYVSDANTNEIIQVIKKKII